MRRGGVSPVVWLAVLLGAGACRDVAGPEPRLEPHRTVYGVLQVGSPAVGVLAEELLAEGPAVPLRGARASLAGAGATTMLQDSAPGLPGCFATSPGFPGPPDAGCYAGRLPRAVAPGAAYTLTLEPPGAPAARGTLVTPFPPAARIPPDSQRITVAFQSLPRDGLPIGIVPVILDSAPGAHRVEVVATVERAVRLRSGGANIEPSRCGVAASTSGFRPPHMSGVHDFLLYEVLCVVDGSIVPWEALDLHLHVVAMDENYARYAEDVLGGSSLDAARAGFGVEGAVGVFGAVARTVLPLQVRFVP